MNTAQVLSYESQKIFKTNTISTSTVVDHVKDWQGMYRVSLNKIVNLLWHIQLQLMTVKMSQILNVTVCFFRSVSEDIQLENIVK